LPRLILTISVVVFYQDSGLMWRPFEQSLDYSHPSQYLEHVSCLSFQVDELLTGHAWSEPYSLSWTRMTGVADHKGKASRLKGILARFYCHHDDNSALASEWRQITCVGGAHHIKARVVQRIPRVSWLLIIILFVVIQSIQHYAPLSSNASYCLLAI
jgi:hypothetical protein